MDYPVFLSGLLIKAILLFYKPKLEDLGLPRDRSDIAVNLDEVQTSFASKGTVLCLLIGVLLQFWSSVAKLSVPCRPATLLWAVFLVGLFGALFWFVVPVHYFRVKNMDRYVFIITSVVEFASMLLMSRISSFVCG